MFLSLVEILYSSVYIGFIGLILFFDLIISANTLNLASCSF